MVIEREQRRINAWEYAQHVLSIDCFQSNDVEYQRGCQYKKLSGMVVLRDVEAEASITEPNERTPGVAATPGG